MNSEKHQEIDVVLSKFEEDVEDILDDAGFYDFDNNISHIHSNIEFSRDCYHRIRELIHDFFFKILDESGSRIILGDTLTVRDSELYIKNRRKRIKLEDAFCREVMNDLLSRDELDSDDKERILFLSRYVSDISSSTLDRYFVQNPDYKKSSFYVTGSADEVCVEYCTDIRTSTGFTYVFVCEINLSNGQNILYTSDVPDRIYESSNMGKVVKRNNSSDGIEIEEPESYSEDINKTDILVTHSPHMLEPSEDYLDETISDKEELVEAYSLISHLFNSF